MKLLALVVLAVLSVTMLGACGRASCDPQRVSGVNAPCGSGAAGFMWTGTSCIYTRACNCTGPDCQRLYSTQEGCETAHIHCGH